MSLTLYSHPLSSFCQKVLIGLYELEIPFTQRVIDLANERDRAALAALWPLALFPVLRDGARDVTLPETSIILEYLERHYGRGACLLPSDPDRALACRLRDRFFDVHVNVPMGKIVTDKLRPAGQQDVYGVAQAKAQLETAYGIADAWLTASTWAAGESFSLADCAAAPALFYAEKVVPFGDGCERLSGYLSRIRERPSFARVIDEAQPYWTMFPG